MEKVERGTLPKGGMEVLVGVCPTGKGAPAVGRLISCKEGCLPSSHGAFLAVLRQPPSVAVDYDGQTGMILVGDFPVSDDQLARVSCPLLRIPELPEGCLGKIGLLDPSSATLFVSPDLSAVGRYTEYWDRERWQALGNGEAADGMRLRWAARGGETPVLEEGEWLADGRRLPLPQADAEEVWYERYCELADCAMGTPVTVIVPFLREASEQNGFQAMIRAVFRAAVYGSFSILISGCLTEADVRSAREGVHRAFCDLEGEGREFNGYVPKGIVIERPALLFSDHAWEGVDRIVLEMEELFYGLTGRCSSGEAEDDALWQMLEPAFVEWTRRRSGARLCAILRTATPSPALYRLLWRCGMEDCFFLETDLWETKRYLRELVEEHRADFQKIFEEKREKFSKNT